MLVLGLVFFSLGEVHKRRDWRQEFLSGRGGLTGVTETLIEADSRNSLLEFRLSSDSGVRVRGNIRVPANQRVPHPALVLLGGLRTGKETLSYIGPTEGVILVALDYPYEGKRRDLSAIEAMRSLPAMRRAIVNTPFAAAITLDYLLDREDVDPDRITLVGGSIGALFGPAVATDARFTAVALLLGGAELDGLLEANLDVPAILKKPIAWPLSIIVSPVEPAKYVGAISPRPLLMINATEDPAIPPEYARRLHDTAREPKTVRWIQAGHLTIRDKEFGRLVIRELVTWLIDHDLAPPGAFGLDMDDSPDLGLDSFGCHGAARVVSTKAARGAHASSMVSERSCRSIALPGGGASPRARHREDTSCRRPA